MTVYETYTLLLQIKLLRQHPVLERMTGTHAHDLILEIEHKNCKTAPEKIHFDRIFTVWMQNPDQYPLTEFALASYLCNWRFAHGATQILTNHYRKVLCLRQPSLFARHRLWQ